MRREEICSAKIVLEFVDCKLGLESLQSSPSIRSLSLKSKKISLFSIVDKMVEGWDHDSWENRLLYAKPFQQNAENAQNRIITKEQADLGSRDPLRAVVLTMGSPWWLLAWPSSSFLSLCLPESSWTMVFATIYGVGSFWASLAIFFDPQGSQKHLLITCLGLVN